MLKPDASPSIPSIRFIAFTTYTTAKQVTIHTNHSGSSFNQRNPKRLSIDMPEKTIRRDAIICTINLATYLTPTKSSAIPTRNISKTAHIIKYTGTIDSVNTPKVSTPKNLRLKPTTTAIEKRIDGKNAIPPSRGTTPLWIFRSSTSSKSFLRNAIRRICGIIIPASTRAIEKDIKSLVIQLLIRYNYRFVLIFSFERHFHAFTTGINRATHSKCKVNSFFQAVKPSERIPTYATIFIHIY